MRTSIAVLSLMTSIVLASPIAKAQYGPGIVADECAVALCPQVLCSSDDYSACLCQNAAELACKEKCPTYTPLKQYCKRHDVASEGDGYGSGNDDDTDEDSPSYPDFSDDTEASDGGVEEEDGDDVAAQEDEGADDATNENYQDGKGEVESFDPSEPIDATPETTGPTRENGSNDQTTHYSLLDADVDVDVASDADNDNDTNNGQNTDYSLIDADANIGSGSSTGGATIRCSSLVDVDLSILSSSSDDDCTSLIDADVDILKKSVSTNSPSQSGNSALVNIEIEINRLLDLKINLLGDNGNGRDSLIDINVELNHLLEIKAQLLSLVDMNVTVGSESGNGDSLIDIEVQISHLLDLKVNVLGDSEESLSDEEHDHLIDIDAQIEYLLDLHVGTLRKM